MRYKITASFGWLNIVFSLCGMATVLIQGGIQGYRTEAIMMALLLQSTIGASIVYASHQKAAGTDIGEKAYPATLAAYILFALFIYRWLFSA